MPSRYYKLKETDTIWWLDIPDDVGTYVFSFDRKRNINLFSEYPDALTPEEKAIFDKENPEWAKFFSYRKYNKE